MVIRKMTSAKKGDILQIIKFFNRMTQCHNQANTQSKAVNFQTRTLRRHLLGVMKIPTTKAADTNSNVFGLNCQI